MYAIHGQPINFADCDVAVIYARNAPEITGAVVTELLSGTSAPVCSHSFLQVHGPLDRPGQIVAAGVLHDTDISGWQQWLDAASGGSATPPKGPVYEDFNLMRAAALAGQGSAAKSYGT